MGKITMQDIADALNISRVTVSKAFNDQNGVSDSLKQLIFEKAQQLGYIKSNFKSNEDTLLNHRTVSLIVSRPDSAMFWTNIIHRMAQELATYDINLIYTYVPSKYTTNFTLPPILSSGIINGIVVLNIYDTDMLKLINTLPIPKVFLDTVPSLTNRQLHGDLLLIEGYRTEYEITEYVIKKGYRRIGFIGDIQYAMTNMERYLGYKACMSDYELTIDPSQCFIDPIDIFSYEENLFSFLKQLCDWPDVFICVSDYVAHFIHDYMEKYKTESINSVLLTGFDNATEYTNVAEQITSANVPTELLGKRLAAQLSFRIAHPEAPYELTFISPTIIHPK